MRVQVCPGCRKPERFTEINSGHHWRCAGCSWLCVREGDQMRTAFPAAVAFKPSKGRRKRSSPPDGSRLDRILRGESP